MLCKNSARFFYGSLAILLILFNNCSQKNPIEPDSTVIINPETRVLKNGTMQYIKHQTENEIVFDSQAKEMTKLKTGNIIVSGEGNGFLRKIIATEITQTEVKVHTEPAKLTDVFEQASINTVQQLNPTDFQQITPLKKEVSLIDVQADLFKFEINNLILYDGDGIESTTNDQLSASGSLTVSSPQFQIEIDIKSASINYLLFTGSINETSDLEIRGEIQLFHLKKEFQIARLTGKPIVFLVGSVPIVLTPVLSVAVGIELDAGASMTSSVFSATQQANYTAGIVYKKGAITRVSDFSNQFQHTLPKVTVNCNLKGFVYPKFEMLLYEFVSLYLKPVEYLEINAQIYNIPWWGLYAGIDVFIGIAVDVFNLFDIAYEYQVIDYRHLLADAGEAFNFPTHGLVADYPFNGNANDLTENKNHGIINGATLISDRFDYPAKAFHFDGSNDYIEIPYTSANHPANEISVVCWFRIDTLRGHQDIISTNQHGGYALEFHADNHLYWVLRIGSEYFDVAVNSVDVTLHQWHCVVGTYDGLNLKIYLNGVLKDERARQGTIHYAHQNSVMLGADAYEKTGPDPGFGFFKGDIDDIRIYNRMLTEKEIQELAVKN